MRGRVLTLVGGVGLALVLGACGGGSSNSSSTTLQPLGPTVFVTIPPTSTTLSANIDTGSAGAAGDPTAPGGQGTYTVQSGDYPLKVAKLLGCSWDEIAAYNDIADPSKFAPPGKVLKVPVTCAGSADTTSAGGGATATTVTPTTKTTVASASKTTTTVPADGSGTYTILAGDTLSGIAKKFNTKMATIVTLNGWSDGIQHNLIPGKSIKVPAP
jgi:LysM repeat protein